MHILIKGNQCYNTCTAIWDYVSKLGQLMMEGAYFHFLSQCKHTHQRGGDIDGVSFPIDTRYSDTEQEQLGQR